LYYFIIWNNLFARTKLGVDTWESIFHFLFEWECMRLYFSFLLFLFEWECMDECMRLYFLFLLLKRKCLNTMRVHGCMGVLDPSFSFLIFSILSVFNTFPLLHWWHIFFLSFMSTLRIKYPFEIGEFIWCQNFASWK